MDTVYVFGLFLSLESLLNEEREEHSKISLETAFSVRVKQQVTLTHGLLWLSNTMGLMGSAMDNQKHLAIKPNNTNKYKQTRQALTSLQKL